MYALASQMTSLPIISLQTGEAVALTKSPIIDIGSFEIKAYRCEGARQKHDFILMARDVRQLAADCVIIDNEEELVEPGDLVRLSALLKANYSPIDKTVVSDTGRKLGHVEDYTVNLETHRVDKLHVRQSMFRAWLGSNLLIDRSQIIDVTPKVIPVRDATVRASVLATEPVPETPS
jgi:sporulation protein YlmC with PRC-barrel domain